MLPKSDMLQELGRLLAEALTTRNRGGDHARVTRMQGIVDGYMRALLDSGVATNEELLAIVASSRSSVDGPATRVVEADELKTAAA